MRSRSERRLERSVPGAGSTRTSCRLGTISPACARAARTCWRRRVLLVALFVSQPKGVIITIAPRCSSALAIPHPLALFERKRRSKPISGIRRSVQNRGDYQLGLKLVSSCILTGRLTTYTLVWSGMTELLARIRLRFVLCSLSLFLCVVLFCSLFLVFRDRIVYLP